jgi:xanthine permease XanP
VFDRFGESESEPKGFWGSMAVRPPDLLYGVGDRPPAFRLAALGLQYAVLVSVYLTTIVITARAAGASPDLQADLVSLALVAAAIGTAVQAYNGRFFGSGYLAPPVFSAMYLAPSVLAARHDGLAAVAAMTVFAGLVEIVISRFLTRLRVVFQPLITGFTIFVVGIQFGLVAIAETLDVDAASQAGFGDHVAVGLLTLALAIGLSVWGRGIVHLMCTLIALLVGAAAAVGLGLIGAAEMAAVSKAPWLALPDPSILSWHFDPAFIPAFAAAGLAASIRAAGVVTTAQRINDASWKRPDIDNLSRGVVGDGLGTVAAGLLGAIGMSMAPSMVAMSGVTGATSRVIAYATAIALLVFACVPKVGAVIVGLPTEIVGGIFLFAASFLIASGLEIMGVRGFDIRAGFAVSISLLLALAAQFHPGYFAQLPDVLRTIAADLLTLSLVVVIGLTLLFRIGIRKTDRAAWRASDTALDDLKRLLDKEKAGWKLTDDQIERAEDTAASLVGHLTDGRYLTDPVTITASTDQIELMIELVYRGHPLQLPAHHAAPHKANDEWPASAGLKTLAAGNHADRASVSTHSDEVRIRLWFAA